MRFTAAGAAAAAVAAEVAAAAAAAVAVAAVAAVEAAAVACVLVVATPVSTGGADMTAGAAAVTDAFPADAGCVMNASASTPSYLVLTPRRYA